MTKSGLGLFGNILGRINTEMKGLGSGFPFADISRQKLYTKWET